MAAGLSLPQAKLNEFKDAFVSVVEQLISDEQLKGSVQSDGELSDVEFTTEVAELIKHSGPWGQGFPEPLFDGRFAVLNQRTVADKYLKLTVKPSEGTTTIDAILFNPESLEMGDPLTDVHMVYRLDINEFQGTRSPQLVVVHLRSIN